MPRHPQVLDACLRAACFFTYLPTYLDSLEIHRTVQPSNDPTRPKPAVSFRVFLVLACPVISFFSFSGPFPVFLYVGKQKTFFPPPPLPPGKSRITFPERPPPPSPFPLFFSPPFLRELIKEAGNQEKSTGAWQQQQ